MREIKFRQPIRDKNGAFIEWWYWGIIENSFISPVTHQNGNDTKHESQQLTGLKDKNGKEVYEGDIVDYGNGRNKVVEFIDGCFCICGITAMPKLMTLYPVIGNIYENPELLK